MTQRGVNPAFVAAKLAQPQVGQVPLRPQTLTAFRQAITRRLTLLCAPAGYGKTTTAAHLVDRLGLDSIWYKLDVLDHDPVVFIASLTHAFQTRDPTFGELLLERVRSSAEVPFSLEEMVAMFVAECSNKVDGAVHIVLDDYQEAADSRTLNWTLDYLLASLPSRFRFVVLSRYDPAFSVSKLRLADEVGLLGVDLLRFDADQATTVLSAHTSRTPPSAAVERLIELTEGWPASLVLASFALEWLDLDSLETALSDPRLKQDIYSYLAEQVYLSEQDPARHFLQQTCCLEHVTGELGNALAGIEHAHRQLADLAAKQAFTFATGTEGSYRYHNLFRDYLRQRFVQEHGAVAFHDLQIRTIEALEACGEVELSVDLSLTVNEPTRALDIIARTGEPGFDNVRSESLDSWVSRLEWSTAASSPWTGLLRSQVLLRAGDFDAALHETEVILNEFAADSDRLGLYHAYSARECALFWSGDMQQASEACRLALAHADTASHKAHTLISLGSAALETRDWERAEASYGEAEKLIVGVDSPDHQRLRTLKALMKYYQGDVYAAQREMRLAVASKGPSGHRASVLNSLGMVEFALAQYGVAREHFLEALAAAEQFGSQHLIPIVQDCLGLCCAATGEVEDGIRLLQSAARTDTVRSDSATLALCISHLGTVLRRSGRLKAAATCYKEACDSIVAGRDQYVQLNCAANLELARNLMSFAELERLNEIAELALQGKLHFVALKARLFQGMILINEGCPQEAAEPLRQSVPELLRLGQLNLLVQEGSGDASLVPHLLSAISQRDAAEKFMRLLQENSGQGQPRQAWQVPEHLSPLAAANLTPREKQVLSLMAAGARNDHIAETLYVSMATVKTHVNHIFTKLGVSDRVQAVLLYKESTADGREDEAFLPSQP